MLTPRQQRFLECLQQALDDHPSHGFLLKERETEAPARLVLRFPYGTGIKSKVDKDHRNFDYKIDALFNKKLREAMEIVVYFNSLFPEATKMTKDIVIQKMRRQSPREMGP